MRNRVKVMNGTIKQTTGGLTKKDLKYNKSGRIVSVKKSRPIRTKLRANEFYCLSCRARTTSENVKNTTARMTGQNMIKGICNHCENKVCKFVK